LQSIATKRRAIIAQGGAVCIPGKDIILMTKQTIEDACRNACESIGVDYKPVPTDGLFHTADLTGDHKGKNDGRIKIFQDRQGGIAWNHKSGVKQTFFINRLAGEPTPQVDHEHIQREQQRRQLEQQTQHDKAATKALSVWNKATPAPANHPYLIRKQIQAHGARLGSWARSVKDDAGKYRKIVIENCLLLPLYNELAVLRSLQAIFTEHHPILDRGKDFMPGGGLAGLFWWLGAKTEKVLIAEGFATAATLHKDTGYRVYMAFTSNNLLAVGRIVREKLPTAEIVFCADNDTKTKGNPGLTKANEAAEAVNGSVAVAPIHGDFNDYAINLKAASLTVKEFEVLIDSTEDFEVLTEKLPQRLAMAGFKRPAVEMLISKIAKKACVPKASLRDVMRDCHE